MAYFDKRFDERKAVLDKFFGVLDGAVEGQDRETLHVALEGILGVLKDNPLADLESFRKSMLDPDHLLEL